MVDRLYILGIEWSYYSTSCLIGTCKMLMYLWASETPIVWRSVTRRAKLGFWGAGGATPCESPHNHGLLRRPCVAQCNEKHTSASQEVLAGFTGAVPARCWSDTTRTGFWDARAALLRQKCSEWVVGQRTPTKTSMMIRRASRHNFVNEFAQLSAIGTSRSEICWDWSMHYPSIKGTDRVDTFRKWRVDYLYVFVLCFRRLLFYHLHHH